MDNETENYVLRNPGIYLVDLPSPTAGSVVMVSQAGKLFAMKLDQELRRGHFNPKAFVRYYLRAGDGGIGTVDGQTYGHEH